MPAVVQNASILRAARQAIDVLLKFKGTVISLVPADLTIIPKPGGGHDFPNAEDQIPIAPQIFALAKIGADEISESDTDGGRVVTRSYLLTGKHDAIIANGYTWSDAEADYLVESVDNTSGYKTVAGVIGYLKGVAV